MKPAEKAGAAKGPVEAMRMAEAWMNELSAEDATPQRAAELDAGLAVLEERFPDINAYGGSAEEFAQSRGHGTGSRGGGKERPDAELLADAAAGAGEAVGKRSKQKGAGSSKRNTKGDRGRARAEGGRKRGGRGRRGRSGLDRRSRQALRDTGIPEAASGTSSLVLSVLGITVGISLAYLLLVNAESSGPGRSAIAQIANGTARAVQSLILPIDPLAGVKGAREAASAAAAPVSPKTSAASPAPARPRGRRPKLKDPYRPHPA